MKWKVFVVSFAAIVALFICIRLYQNDVKTSQPRQSRSHNSQPQALRVRLLEVQVGLIEESSDFIALADSRCSVTLRSQIEGYITHILARPGDTVAVGDVIIQVESAKQLEQPRHFNILAPCAGTVGDIPVKEGGFVNTNTQLTSVSNNRPLELNISVPIAHASQLRKGMPVKVIDQQGYSNGTSKVFFIAPNASENGQSILIKALFDNSKGELRVNQFVQARVIWDQRPGGVIIPTTAVSPIGGQNFVYVAQTQQSSEGKPQFVARQVLVRLGNTTGNTYQVLEGLQPGEKIIVSGLLNLREGAVIIPEP